MENFFRGSIYPPTGCGGASAVTYPCRHPTVIYSLYLHAKIILYSTRNSAIAEKPRYRICAICNDVVRWPCPPKTHPIPHVLPFQLRSFWAVVELQHNLWGGPKIRRAIASLENFFEAPPEVTFRGIKMFFYCNFSTKTLANCNKPL